MLSAQVVPLGAFWGLIFGTVFCLATLTIGRINVEMLLNDYPPDVKAAFGTMRPEVHRQASSAGRVLLALLLAVLVGGLLHLRVRSGLSWANSFFFLLIVLQIWNLIDLVVLDWFLLMTLRPRFMILPGTDGLPGYRDYRFHFVKFLKGIVLTALLAGVLTVVVMAAEAVFG